MFHPSLFKHNVLNLCDLPPCLVSFVAFVDPNINT